MASNEDKLRDIQRLIERITSSDRMRSNAHFSQAVYRDEPILTTGRQMASYLPERYREMRAITRWQEEPGKRGRWLSEAELFYRQGMFMADFEDDCPYHGEFKSYYPTYNAMSDRQLRGYFTWRTRVRHGDIQETSLSFVYLYIYELLNGIGVTNAEEGFERLRTVWQAYRKFSPEIDRFVVPWLRDYVIYHGLDPALLEDDPTSAFDRALLRLVQASTPFDPQVLENIDELTLEPESESPAAASNDPAAPARETALPLPPDSAREGELLEAIDALSTYRVRLARLYHDYPDDLRHVTCAVFVRLLRYYRKNRVNGLIESLFGEQARMPYTMFGSAVFFEPHLHADVDYLLDPIHGYRCRNGRWECVRTYGAHDKSSKLGAVMRAVDRKLRDALSYPHPLKEQKLPKYLAEMIDKEISAWLSWKEAHAPRRVDIDLAQLAGIRRSAAEIREALLTDEEREDTDGMPSFDAPAPVSSGAVPQDCSRSERSEDCLSTEETGAGASRGIELSARDAVMEPGENVAETASDLGDDANALDAVERAYLQALLAGTAPTVPAGASEDMLVDGINEKLFDLVGDTVIEFGAADPQVIEGYEDDVRGVLAS